MRYRWTACCGILVIIGVVGCDRPPPPAALDPVSDSAAQRNQAPSIYSVATYDPARDAARDLAMTVTQAKADRKRILLEIGGEW